MTILQQVIGGLALAGLVIAFIEVVGQLLGRIIYDSTRKKGK